MLIETHSPEDTAAAAEEAATLEASKAALIADQSGEDQPQESGDDLILGKYKTYADLEEAYRNLEREYSRVKNGQQSAPASTEPKEEGQARTEGANTAGADPGVSEEAAAAAVNAVLRQAGGEQGYQELTRWASAFVDPERIEAYNAALRKGDAVQAVTALKAMQYDFQSQNGYTPSLISGKAPSTSTVKPFDSEQQVVDAMNDPRYSGLNPDPAYIREVERRLAASDNVFAAR